VVYLVLTSSKKIRESVAALEDAADAMEAAENTMGEFQKWLYAQSLDDEYNVIKNAAKQFSLNLSQARERVEKFPSEYKIEGESIVDVVKRLRDYRTTLKGDIKKDFTKSIVNVINGYSSHLDDCIKSIYWLSDYQKPLKSMSFKESDLRKIYEIKDYTTRAQLVDILCKYWEADLERKSLQGTEYFKSEHSLIKYKGQFKTFMKSLPNRYDWTDKLNTHILKCVSDDQGITCRSIMDKMDSSLQKRSSPQIIAKHAKKIGVTIVEEQYYKLNDTFKKDINAYTAAFIDSDGYITLDKNLNPRVGLIATGDRGKAFMIEMHKALGSGKLHLDQKSPQNTRAVNRLNFYSQDDVHKVLTQCRPHFRMKGPQADLLLELVRIKKNHKKQDWAKDRMQEIYKLMKWYNHSDNKSYDWLKYDVDIFAIDKLEGNCKMNLMDELDSISKGDEE
tara:strand:+ start:35 stop:1378 length:1344 start_codon:yes stop_codon:yes gene_type:complete